MRERVRIRVRTEPDGGDGVRQQDFTVHLLHSLRRNSDVSYEKRQYSCNMFSVKRDTAYQMQAIEHIVRFARRSFGWSWTYLFKSPELEGGFEQVSQTHRTREAGKRVLER